MSALTGAVLAVGLAATVLSGIGIIVVRNPYQRLHLLAPASILGAPAVLIAVMLQDPHPGRSTVKLLIILAILVVSAPTVTMATARATAERDRTIERHSP